MPTHRPVVLVFGRFNPPTTGHEALIAFVKNIAHRVNADVRIYASPSQDARKNPLPFRVKIQYLRRFFPGVTFSDSTAIRTPFDALGELSQLGYTDVILVAGSDRVRDYEKLGTYLLPRNSPKYDSTKHIAINSYKVVSVPGDRDPDAEGVSGMSASKLRKLAADNDYTAFRQGIPSHASERDAKNLFKQVRQYMGLHETFKVRAGQFAVGLFEDHLKVGDKVHAGLAQRGGAGFSGVVDRIEHDYVYVNIGKDKYGDRIIKAPNRNVMKEADGGYTPAKPETETDRLRTSQQQELIALKTRQANQMMAAKLRDVQNKAREAQMKATQPKPAAKPAS